MEKTIYMLYKFFKKSVGDWISHRSYFYPNKKEVINSVTEFTWEEINSKSFTVSWNNVIQNSKGSFGFHFENDFEIKRSAGYFTSNATKSSVILSSERFLKTETIYNNMKFVETIEFVNDKTRVRRTVAHKYNKLSEKFDLLFLIGNYIEYKKEN